MHVQTLRAPSGGGNVSDRDLSLSEALNGAVEVARFFITQAPVIAGPFWTTTVKWKWKLEER